MSRQICATGLAEPRISATVSALNSFVNWRLERSHIPDYIQVVDELSKTASEKVQTRFLAAALDASTPGVYLRRGFSAPRRTPSLS